MIVVKVRNNDVDFALRILKKQVQKSGFFESYGVIGTMKNLRSGSGGKNEKGLKIPGNGNMLCLAPRCSDDISELTSGGDEHDTGTTRPYGASPIDGNLYVMRHESPTCVHAMPL